MKNNSTKIFHFFIRSAPLVIAGVALGLIARSLFGEPQENNTMDRKFKNPVPEFTEDPVRLMEEKEFPVSDIDF